MRAACATSCSQESFTRSASSAAYFVIPQKSAYNCRRSTRGVVSPCPAMRLGVASDCPVWPARLDDDRRHRNLLVGFQVFNERACPNGPPAEIACAPFAVIAQSATALRHAWRQAHAGLNRALPYEDSLTRGVAKAR